MDNSTEEKNRFLVFDRAGLHLHVRKVSSFLVKLFKFFAWISYILDNGGANIILLFKYTHFHTSTNQENSIWSENEWILAIHFL